MNNNLKKGRYTKYTNKIGLYSDTNGSFIKNDTEVVLNFPFKDTVLEAGMSKEDVGRDERFLHQTMDSKDIDTLEEPKVLTNFKYIDKNGEYDLDTNSDIKFFDEKGGLKQNLLIKGNNLLALHTLKQKLAGKVKLIYIDPPYNTGNDGFKYNDKFNHSSWLVFMKNRLEEAKKLLREDGVIFVQCDDNEQAYLRILMDEVFARENFLGNLIWKSKITGGHDSNNLNSVHEYVLCFSKVSFHDSVLNKRVSDKTYPEYDSKQDKTFKWDSLWTVSHGYTKNCDYPILAPDGSEIHPYMCHKSGEKVKGLARWFWNKENFEKNKEDLLIKQVGDSWKVYKKVFAGSDIAFQSVLDQKDVGGTSAGKAELEMLFNNINTFSNPKPEFFVKKLLEIGTRKNDIVLDYHLGSGTTAAVAHKMGRRWIGIEQMDYIEGIAKVRLQKVIKGEQGGISKAVNWQGGGDFVYMELKQYNQAYIDRIMQSETKGELEDAYKDMTKNAFLKFFFDKKKFEKDEAFRSLSLDERKEILIGILDENQLYLNYADMNDTRYKVTEDEKTLTNKFYGEEK